MNSNWICGVAAGVLAFTLAACESEPLECESSSSGDAAAFLTVEGFTIQHSLCKKASGVSGEPIDSSNLLVEVVDPADLGDAGSGIPIATQPLDVSTLGESPADWSFTGVNLPETTSGLLASIKDGRTADPLWVTTYMTIADVAAVEELRASYGAMSDVRTFALTRDVIDSVVGPLVGLSGDELMARGMLIGIVVDQPDSCGAEQPPVSDCTVSTDRADVTISYPNSKVSALTDKTSNQGMFFAVPSAVGDASTAGFSVTPGSFDSREWGVASPAWIVPGSVSIQLFVAQ